MFLRMAWLFFTWAWQPGGSRVACQVSILRPNSRNMAFLKVVWHEKMMFGMFVIVWRFLDFFHGVGMKKCCLAFFETFGLVSVRLLAWKFRNFSQGCWCCDGKARAACAQSFTVWQQETREIMRCNHSIIACSCHIYMGVVLRAHSVRGPRLREPTVVSPPVNKTDPANYRWNGGWTWRLTLSRGKVAGSWRKCKEKKKCRVSCDLNAGKRAWRRK